MSEERWHLIRIKRRWVPEWLFSALKPVIGFFPFKQMLMRELTEFEDRRFNG